MVKSDLRWVKFRYWMISDSPRWLHWLYTKYGETFAKFIKNKPVVKSILMEFSGLDASDKQLRKKLISLH